MVCPSMIKHFPVGATVGTVGSCKSKIPFDFPYGKYICGSDYDTKQDLVVLLQEGWCKTYFCHHNMCAGCTLKSPHGGGGWHPPT
jgi:hypothetical protein